MQVPCLDWPLGGYPAAVVDVEGMTGGTVDADSLVDGLLLLPKRHVPEANPKETHFLVLVSDHSAPPQILTPLVHL